MSLTDDILNGGVDRNFDGKIDRKDQELMFMEECKKKEKEKYSSSSEYNSDYNYDCDDYDDDGDEDCDDYDCDDEDYDDDDDYGEDDYSSPTDISYIGKTREELLPTYSGQKIVKGEKIVIEWENIPREKAKKARIAEKSYYICSIILIFGFLIGVIVPLLFVDKGNDCEDFIKFGLIAGGIGLILTAISASCMNELTRYYSHVEDEKGVKKYISEYEKDMQSKGVSAKNNKVK